MWEILNAIRATVDQLEYKYNMWYGVDQLIISDSV